MSLSGIFIIEGLTLDRKNLFKKTCLFPLVLLPLMAFACFYSHLAYSASNLALNGAAKYIERKNIFYIGGLFLESPSDNLDDILSTNTHKRMQLVVVKSEWSKYEWKKYWRERIAANNINAKLDPATIDGLKMFTKLLRGKLLRGDEVSIEYDKKYTKIYLNRELVASTPGIEVFKCLVLTWVGEVPPSLKFRDSILMGSRSESWDVDSDVLIKHRIPFGRDKVFSNWKSQEDLIVKQRQEQERQQKEKERFLAEQKAQLELKLAQRKAKQKAIETAAYSKPKPQSVNKAEQDKQRQLQARRQQEEAEKYYREYLQWYLQSKVNALVTYPAWEKDFGEEGLVTVDVKVSKNGELKTKVVENDTDKNLIYEVLSAIKNSGVENQVPQEAAADNWNMQVAYLFSLQEESQPKLIAPLRPRHLKAEKVSNQKFQQILSGYKDSLYKTMHARIDNIPTLRFNRGSGRIKLRVGVDQRGEVTALDILKKSRNAKLNKSIEKAIRDAAPYEVFPQELSRLEKVNIDIDYSFRN